MTWAMRRRLIILSTLGAIVLIVLAIVLTPVFYKAPSCIDGKQNQNESGVDCGGPCAYLCTADVLAPTVLFTQTVPNGTGRTDVVALVENRNMSAAARAVPYEVTLYGAGQALVQTITGVVDLPPGARMPIFIPGVASGKQVVKSAFLEIAATAPKWFSIGSDSRTVPVVTKALQGGTLEAPRVEATLTNPSSTTLSNVRVVVLVRDAQQEIVGASATIVPTLSAQGEAQALFTWSAPFASPAAFLEVLPLVPLTSP